MQRCLEKGLVSQKMALADKIIDNAHILIECPFGNYLVQNVLKLKSERHDTKVWNILAGDFTRLSQLKFSSNVMEKSLDTSQAATQIEKIFKGTHFVDDKALVRQLGYQSRDLSARVTYLVQSLANNQFGNYVLQKALLIFKDDELRNLVLNTISSLAPRLMETKHGAKVIGKLQKTYPLYFADVETTNGIQMTVKREGRGRRGG